MGAVTVTSKQLLVLGRHSGFHQALKGFVPRRLIRMTTASMSKRGSVMDCVQGRPDITTYEELHRFSVEHPDKFWGDQARNNLTWSKEFTRSMDCDMHSGSFKWFEDGQLNASVNCVDRHAAANPDKVALIWEKDEPGQDVKVTYGQLLQMVSRIANVFKSRGIGRGDVVAIYMPISPLAVASMLACTRIGAIHSVIFAGFSAGAIASRIQNANAVALVTANEGVRGGKAIPLKKTANEAIKDGNCPSLKHTFYMSRTENQEHILEGDINLEAEMSSVSDKCQPEVMDSEDLMYILYTSGSTGAPKGVAHSTAGYLVYAGFTQKHVFGYYDNDDVFGCVADIGWITGHSYVVYGPLVNGGTTLLFESTPTYPDPGRYWEMIEKHRVSQFYCAPTAVRLLLKYGDSFVESRDLSSIKTIGSVGEPINPGGICIAPRPSSPGAPIVPGMAMRAVPGMNPVLMDEKGKEVQGDRDIAGALCLKTPWPGMARTVYGSHKRYMETYLSAYPGYYFTGDGARRDENGYWQITGRVDDVINITGHRLGTAEVETVIAGHELVAESAVVGFPHEVKGESICAFVTLKEEAAKVLKNDVDKQEQLIKELKAMIKSEIAGFAVPEHTLLCSALPKTRSGKIMRRILRKIASSDYDNLGDISTLAEPEVVAKITAQHSKLAKK